MALSAKQGTGRMGHGIAPGLDPTGYTNKFMAHGAFLQAPTTAVDQQTGTGDLTVYYNISDGVVVVDGVVLNIVAAADTLLETAADILDDGQSRVYTIMAWLHPSTGVVAVKSHPGTIALLADIVEATIAEIEASLPVDVDGSPAKFIKLATATVNRTGATSATESHDNSVRDLGFAE